MCICLCVNFVLFSRSEIQGVALKLASKIIAYRVQSCEKVRLILYLS